VCSKEQPYRAESQVEKTRLSGRSFILAAAPVRESVVDNYARRPLTLIGRVVVRCNDAAEAIDHRLLQLQPRYRVTLEVLDPARIDLCGRNLRQEPEDGPGVTRDSSREERGGIMIEK
jgi:hypothetical protein